MRESNQKKSKEKRVARQGCGQRDDTYFKKENVTEKHQFELEFRKVSLE